MLPPCFIVPLLAWGSKEKIRFRSSFMLMTTQSFLPASSSVDRENVPNLVSGIPLAGTEAYPSSASSQNTRMRQPPMP